MKIMLQRLYSIKILRWVIGIVVSSLILIGMLFVYKHVEIILLTGIKKSNLYLYFFIHALQNTFIFSAYIVLNCLFSPEPRKYSVLVAVCIEAVGVILLLWSSIGEVPLINPLNLLLVVSMAGFISGIIIGVLSTYALFKNKGWDVEESNESLDVIEQY